MHILFEEHVPFRYRNAIAARNWATVEYCEDVFDQGTPDKEIAEYAEANGCVIFTRDTDFFKLTTSYDCGVLFLHQTKDPKPGRVADAVEAIDQAYVEHSDVEEAIPGPWV